MHGIKYGEEHNITFSDRGKEKYSDVKERVKCILVAMASEEVRTYFGEKGQKQRVILGKDLMLMTRVALLVGALEDGKLNESNLRGHFTDTMREILREYYRSTRSDDEISKYIEEMITEGVLYFILPPISPFVKAYYDALKGTMELVRQAA